MFYTVSGVENMTNLLDKNIWRRGEMQTNEFYTCIYKLTLMERARLNDLIKILDLTLHVIVPVMDNPPPPIAFSFGHFLPGASRLIKPSASRVPNGELCYLARDLVYTSCFDRYYLNSQVGNNSRVLFSR